MIDSRLDARTSTVGAAATASATARTTPTNTLADSSTCTREATPARVMRRREIFRGDLGLQVS